MAFSIINGTAPQAFSFVKNINKAGGGFHIVVEENIFCGRTNASGDHLYFLVLLISLTAFLRIVNGHDWVGNHYAFLRVSLMKAFNKLVFDKIMVHEFPCP